VDLKAETMALAESFTRLESPWFFSFWNIQIILCTLQWWLLQKNCCSIFKMVLPQSTTLVAFFSLSINPCIVGLLWQCEVSIWTTITLTAVALPCQWNVKLHLLNCCTLSWTELFRYW
jgi:hypothetical protein